MKKTRKVKSSEPDITGFRKALNAVLEKYNAAIYVDTNKSLSFLVHANAKNKSGAYTYGSTWFDEPTNFYGVSPFTSGNEDHPESLPFFNVATGSLQER